MDIKVILGGVVGSVLSAAIIGAWQWASRKREDRVRLTADLSQPGELEDMQHVGCASMIVTITCRSTRPAKIKGALIAIEGVDLIPAFEQGFGASFGYVPSKVGPPPALTIGLVPLKKPNADDGFRLERDDALRFALPIQVPILHEFPAAPSQNVWIAVTYVDGTEEIILRGVRIQHTIEDLIAGWGDQKQALKVVLDIGLRATSAVLPRTAHLVGKVNPNPISFVAPPGSATETLVPPSGAVAIRFPVFTFVTPDESAAVIFQAEGGPMMPIFSSREYAVQAQGECKADVRILALPAAGIARAFVENPPMRPGVAVPDFDILYCSVDPDNRLLGSIPRKSMLTALETAI